MQGLQRYSAPPLEIIILTLGSFQTNCYLVFCPPKNKALIIDPADNADLIFSALEQFDLEPATAVLTHGHCDHIAAACKLTDKSIPLLIHAKDAENLKDADLSGASLFDFHQQPCEASRLLAEDDTIDIWEGVAPLRVIHTPGHSSGAICLLTEGVAFVGDLLFAGGIGRTDLPGGNDEEMSASLRRLMELPDTTLVFPGHGPPTAIGNERETNPFLHYLL